MLAVSFSYLNQEYCPKCADSLTEIFEVELDFIQNVQKIMQVNSLIHQGPPFSFHSTGIKIKRPMSSEFLLIMFLKPCRYEHTEQSFVFFTTLGFEEPSTCI